MSEEYIGYHFSSGKEAFGSHRKLVVGQTYRVRPPLVLCRHGLHASERPIDALRYGSGSILSRVRLSGEVLVDSDKACATMRTVLAQADVSNILHEFACWYAEQVLLAERAREREPDERSWAAVEAKRAWLKGDISAAFAVASSVAWDAAWDTAWDAAWDAALTNLAAHLEHLIADVEGLR